MKALDTVLTPIHKAGYPFIAAFAVVTLLLLIFTPAFFGFVGILLTAWCVYFFRNPDRTTPTDENLVISPADGRICMITKATPPKELGLGDIELTRVSVFLNVFDVHVNRMPVAGRVTKVAYHPGKFLNASFDKASDENERNSILIEDAQGRQFPCVQIAGLVARRILCDVREGDSLEAGNLYGIIRFGSRTDIYLPDGVNPLVCVGQKMVGGETVIAELENGPTEARTGEIR